MLVIPKCEVGRLGVFPKDIKIVQTSGLNIGKIAKSKNNTSVNEIAGVYVIPCDTCDKVYIGETDNFQRRTYQHGYALRKSNKFSALVVHEKTNLGHKVNLDASELIVKNSQEINRKILESVLISSCKWKNYNLKEGLMHVDLLMGNCLKNVRSVESSLSKFNEFIDRWKDRERGVLV